MTFRIIPRLDVKPPHLVKGIHLEGVRKLGSPSGFAERYYREGADELFYQDVVASLYGHNTIEQLVQETASKLFIPLTVGGGLRRIDDIQKVLRHGADKVSLNTAAIKNPGLIREASRVFGSQCVVIALEIARSGPHSWEPLIDSGREHTGLDALEWALRVVDLGAGELLVTTIAREGTKQGFDFEFVDALLAQVNVPIVLHGGAGSVSDIVEAARHSVSGVAISSILHYKLSTIPEIKQGLRDAGIAVRP
jgi:cyclase